MNTHFGNGNIFIEITKSTHGHGGHGWEFGTCLWSPTIDRGGRKRYDLMKIPQRGDMIIHFYQHLWNDNVFETRITGTSIVKNRFVETNDQPPNLDIEERFEKYFRIDLHNYEEITNPLSIASLVNSYGAEIRNEIISRRPKYYPFNTYGNSIRTVQGLYLAQCTSNLYLILKDAITLNETQSFNNPGTDYQQEYSEGFRSKRETYFFSRNRRLVRAAKERYGYTCCICNFNFEETYGELGAGYIECHHLNPLSERSSEEWTEELKTNIEGIRVVCSNCHRIIHSKRPALSIEEVRLSLRLR
ncbi:hypothetical protein M4D57_14425 [Brevibacillus borstelensis]|uniref:HNH endonuclease n=1 Tax=Brevibacillus borstelensis TaxID=45462 RepID=UPI001D0B9329|nr:hypothetical protein [Brevibacillus borstelensis]MCC0567529.1 hypothetical protein [Brevibacillus borstelensis]MCM3559767.1 hypothetical protein [Brevibacillus borstelensis]MED1853474.1 hypothetical protein [Brevibacillus borstelensis]